MFRKVLSQSVATDARSGRIFNNRFTANLPRNLPMKEVVNRLRFDRIMATSLWPYFLAHPVYQFHQNETAYSF